ncbi:hypothetical protein [Blastococcus sp. CCUG 61487]|uniref:hypothetical protein n=1 Tax=Blastococcus sp. CCUG 61487 TaxID=1840703 RepID=UPI0010C04280|nr:hypothetical protein [Blastococcus sp. CCUG 61487]TKJ17981.1 hypothetical protein A6V29_01180 [Blastococcus sp. CCUG 61487]
MAESCELVVVLSGGTDEAARLAGAHPEVSFERTPAPPDEGAESWYLTAVMDDRTRAQELARRIGELASVRAVYVKPGGEPPR